PRTLLYLVSDLHEKLEFLLSKKKRSINPSIVPVIPSALVPRHKHLKYGFLLVCLCCVIAWFSAWKSKSECLKALRVPLISLATHVTRLLESQYSMSNPDNEKYSQSAIVTIFKCFTLLIDNAKDYVSHVCDREVSMNDARSIMVVRCVLCRC